MDSWSVCSEYCPKGCFLYFKEVFIVSIGQEGGKMIELKIDCQQFPIVFWRKVMRTYCFCQYLLKIYVLGSDCMGASATLVLKQAQETELDTPPPKKNPAIMLHGGLFTFLPNGLCHSWSSTV